MCIETRGLRSVGVRFKSLAFFTPRFPHYGPFAEDFRNRPGEIRIVGFPKSGNVWISSLVATCLDLDVNFSSRNLAVTHTHRPFHNVDLFNRNLIRGAVLIRDLRDVIVSLYHFTRTDHFKKFYGPHHIYNSLSEMYTDYFLPYFVNRVNVLETLPDDYVKFGWPVIRYERFWDDAETELKRLFQIWGIDVIDEKIRSAVEKNTLDSMRQGKGKTTGGVQTTHFRKGGYGNYETEIPPHILKDIEYRFGDYLRRWGYIV